mgnify:CR=1 FL=1
MKITKALLRNLIKEALEDRINPDDDDLEQAGFRPVPDDMGLEGETFNFQILHTERGTKPFALLKNVPYSMLDPRSIERMKEREAEGYKGPERFLKPSAEALAKIPKYDPRVHRAYHLPDSGVGSREPVVFDGAKFVDAQED